ncbi:acid sphingomyelinase-like phosphodiesterase 3b [Hyalella azteca]|uniref:Acid sphingomyelinase-like phosphodiesterase 3b n=1 Tax=Hyalella azteca TaxID=294128 RepID=A0A8B7NXN1_HYAAZ|nr:acid sphingomyelinase-like phosphodiesterase 3b [Hyalella azteca]
MCSAIRFISLLSYFLPFSFYLRVEAAAIGTESSLQDLGKFWQITDVHWDLNYALDGDPLKMCHRHSISSPPSSSATVEKLQTNGRYGNYLCDAPWMLVNAGLDAMMNIDAHPDFILWTGDIGPHVSDPKPSLDVIFQTMSNVSAELLRRFPPPVAVLPVLGNHDSFPQDDYPNCPSSFFERYLEKGGWSSFLTSEQQESFRRGGYYSYKAPANVKVLVLNTNMYYFGNELGTTDPDPCRQFTWLSNELDTAKLHNYKVMLVGHAPPGFFERFPIIPSFNVTYNEHFIDIVEQSGALIHSQVYGHLHTDTFRIYGSIESGTSSAAFMAPSLTPWQANQTFGGTAVNPSLRLYSYDSVSIMDYKQYLLNLTRANQRPTNPSLLVSKLLEEEIPRDTTQISVEKINTESFIASGDQSSGSWKSELRSVHQNVDVMTEANMIQNFPDDDLHFTTEHWLGSRDLKGVDEHLEDPKHSARPFGTPEPTYAPYTDADLPDLNWELYYEGRKAYSLDRLDGVGMSKLYESLESNEDIFDRYYKRNSAGFSYNKGLCRGHCRKQQLCAIANSRVRDLFSCMAFNKTYIDSVLKRTFDRISVSTFDGYFVDTPTADTTEHFEPTTPVEYPIQDTPLDVCSSKNSLSNHCISWFSPTVIIGIALFWVILISFLALIWRKNRCTARTGSSLLNSSTHGYKPLSSDEH